MPRSGNGTFADPAAFQASFHEAAIDFALSAPGKFMARQTWVELFDLHLVRTEETVPRVAYVSFAPERAWISFPINSRSRPIWAGVELEMGDIVFHSAGAGTHDRTQGACQWGFMSLAPDRLAACGKAVIGRELLVPSVGRVLRPNRPVAMQLLRLHAKVCRLAETKTDVIGHREVSRAAEQGLLHALVNCLVAGDAHGHLETRRRQTNIMARVEDALKKHIDRPLNIREFRAIVGVPERTLSTCCVKFLGMSPGRYLRLRRLNAARAALQHENEGASTVAEIARRYQFSEFGRFAAMYRKVFGEAPSATLRSRPSSIAGEIQAENA